MNSARLSDFDCGKFRCVFSSLVFSIVVTIAFCRQVHASEIKATWQPVTQNVTGATDTMSHYLLYFGRTPRPVMVTHPSDGTFSYEKVLNAGRKTQHMVTGLEPGTWFFSVVAVDMDGNISDYSKEVKFELPDRTGKIPPAIKRKQNPVKTVSTKKPEGGCATIGEDYVTQNLLHGLFFAALILIKRKNQAFTSS